MHLYPIYAGQSFDQCTNGPFVHRHAPETGHSKVSLLANLVSAYCKYFALFEFCRLWPELVNFIQLVNRRIHP